MYMQTERNWFDLGKYISLQFQDYQIDQPTNLMSVRTKRKETFSLSLNCLAR